MAEVWAQVLVGVEVLELVQAINKLLSKVLDFIPLEAELPVEEELVEEEWHFLPKW